MTDELQVGIEKLRFAIRTELSKEFIIEAVDTSSDLVHIMTEDIGLIIRGLVWAEQEDMKHQEIRYPANWWQAVCERFFPKWWLVRHPVLYHIVNLKVKVLYPELRPKLPNEKSVLGIFRSDYEFEIGGEEK